MRQLPLDDGDRELIEAARDVLRRNYRAKHHTVGAAVRCASGKIYTGVNVEACTYGPCAEHVAVGTAFSNGETTLVEIVAVRRRGDAYPVLSPCGACRQLILDYAPDAVILLPRGDRVVKVPVTALLPEAYRYDFD